MIEQMQRVSLLLLYSEKKKVLRSLQNLGVVDLNLSGTETDRMRRSRQEIAEIRKILGFIEAAEKNLAASTLLPQVTLPVEPKAQLKMVQAMLAEKEQLESAVRELKQELIRYDGWGEIPIDGIARLGQKGVGVHLFSGSARFFDQFDFGDECVAVVSRQQNTVRFILVTLHADAPVLPFQKFSIPSRTVAEMLSQTEILSRKLGEANARIAALRKNVPQLTRSINHIETRRRFEQAKHSLSADSTETVYEISGFFPASRKARVLHFLESRKLAYEIAAPAASDNVPVLLKNPPWTRLFEPITRIFSLPEYRELDPTPLFAPFFTLFFGFCMGDVGYGLLLLLISVVLVFKPAMRQLAILGLILAFATLASGVLMNSFFGANLFVRDGGGLINLPHDPAVFAAYTVQGKTVFPAMTLSLLIGCVQIFVAFVVQSVNETIVLGWRYAFKALSMLMLAAAAFILAAHADFMNLGFNAKFIIGPLKVGEWLTAIPKVAAHTALAFGGVLFFFFAAPDRKFWLRPLGGLWDFYGFSTGLMGDFLSYIRLFALALAGGLLGNAFNQIAFMVLPKTSSGHDFATPWVAVTVLILVVGHTLNFALGALGAFVHPLRLTFVEFYKNINFRGGGRSYRPFGRASSVT